MGVVDSPSSPLIILLIMIFMIFMIDFTFFFFCISLLFLINFLKAKKIFKEKLYLYIILISLGKKYLWNDILQYMLEFSWGI